MRSDLNRRRCLCSGSLTVLRSWPTRPTWVSVFVLSPPRSAVLRYSSTDGAEWVIWTPDGFLVPYQISVGCLFNSSVVLYSSFTLFESGAISLALPTPHYFGGDCWIRTSIIRASVGESPINLNLHMVSPTRFELVPAVLQTDVLTRLHYGEIKRRRMDLNHWPLD